MPHRVVALVLPGVFSFDLSCVVQLFGHPPTLDDTDEGLYAFSVCGAGGDRVATGDGFDIVVHAGLEALEEADTVAVPGYAHAWDTRPDEEVLAALRKASERGARVLSICVGAFALAHAGLLDGRRATTHWAVVDRLAAQFPAVSVVSDELYVDDGDVLTSAGLASGIDLGLHVVRADRGAQAAADLARWNVVAPHRDGAQAQFIDTALPDTSATSIASTCAWALGHLDRPLDLADLAAHASISERSLLRRFHDEVGASPKQWLLRARLDRARRLLETTDLTVQEVARASGFPSAAALRQRFTGGLGTTPTAYRRSFHGTGGDRGARTPALGR
ncbi:GlxA family transcriptional regulator [Actinomycetospora sp. TBRC 11914]|uniref:GlxA family transcriptional regulator n=1 Tax=Actinomycetospora sp. TBRC 11914 TaxID=2729387 RepID=UPI00145D46E0|nr:helix-turn-helix domain-containing protein [Actinomycetospora sp. TBRC 11914]NMO92307.1 helix-turn-helix domain-containing protein [Actinomycetospora sp. TBRC 11914]